MHDPCLPVSNRVGSTGVNRGEAAAHYVNHHGSVAMAKTLRQAPAGGASSLGTKPFEIPGTRTPLGRGLYDSHCIAKAADPLG